VYAASIQKLIPIIAIEFAGTIGQYNITFINIKIFNTGVHVAIVNAKDRREQFFR